MKILAEFFAIFWVSKGNIYVTLQSSPNGTMFFCPVLIPSKALSRSLPSAWTCAPQKFWFCIIFSAFLQICWDFQQKHEKKIWFPKSYIKNTSFILVTKNWNNSKTWCKFHFFIKLIIFLGFQSLKLKFCPLLMLEMTLSLLHIVGNTSKYSFLPQSKKTCCGPNVQSFTSVHYIWDSDFNLQIETCLWHLNFTIIVTLRVALMNGYLDV